MTTERAVAAGSDTLGDDTLVGTQLQVISQVQDGVVSKKFQITSAVGLSFEDARNFQGAFPAAPAAAQGILQRAAGYDPRFLAVLAGASDPGQTFFLPVASQLLGRDGFPNLRLILDFRVDGPTATFQIHTILDFQTEDGPDRVEAALARGDRDEILGLVLEHCVVNDKPHLTGMLRGALS